MTALSSIERPLALFTQGLTSRIPLFQAHENATFAFTPERVHALTLPDAIDCFETDVENAETYRWQVMQQIAFHRFGTLKFDVDVARTHNVYLSNRPRPVLHRATHIELLYQHFESPIVAQRLFYLLEEARTRSRILEEFPGSQRLFQRYVLYKNNTMSEDQQKTHMRLAQFERSLHGISQLPSSVKEPVSRLHRMDATVYTSVDALVCCYLELFSEIDPRLMPDDAKESDDAPALETLQRAHRLEEMQQELHDLNANLLAFELNERTQVTTVSDVDEALEGETRETDLDLTRERDQLERSIDMEKTLLKQYGRSSVVQRPRFRYDEWNYLTGSWLKNWCSVYEIQGDQSSDDLAADLIARVGPLVPTVRKRFEHIRPAGLRRVPKSFDGDEVDLDALVEARADVRVGRTPTERIYSRVEKNQRDVSACFLVDLSASTDDPIDPPDAEPLPEDRDDPFDDPYLHGAINFDPDQLERPPSRKIIDVLKESALTLATALEHLGDAYCVFGFSGYGRDCVEIHVTKNMQQSLNRAAVNAIASMKPLRSTRMGPAIRHATRQLLETGSSLKVLMVISDGFPQDCDYGPDRSDHEYGIQDTARAIKEAGQKGVQVFCITVDVSGHDYLKRMCRDDQHLVIEETVELPRALQQVYQQLTV